MAQVTINIPNTYSVVEQVAIRRQLESLAQNISKENLRFLAELSENQGINEKLESKKTLIKTFL